MRWVGTAALTLALGIGGCSAPPAAGPSPNPSSDAQSSLRQAQGYRVERRGAVRLLTITRPWPGAVRELRFVLVPFGVPVPEDLAAVERIEVPVARVATTSTTQLAHLERLGALDQLVAHAGLERAYSPRVLALAEAGEVAEIGRGEEGVDPERLAFSGAQLIFTYPMGPDDHAATLRWQSLGVLPMPNSEWVEKTPLGRAEWLRFTALFLGEEAERRAELEVRGVTERYRELAARVAEVEVRPRVLVGAPFRGTWWMPGAETFMARLIADAGGTYVGSSEPTDRTLALDLETVLARAGDADVWLQPGSHGSRSALLASEPRLSSFAALEAGEVWNNTERMGPGGGNDYWESGPIRIDEVLADLVRMFHPDLLREHQLVFHRRLEP